MTPEELLPRPPGRRSFTFAMARRCLLAGGNVAPRSRDVLVAGAVECPRPANRQPDTGRLGVRSTDLAELAPDRAAAVTIRWFTWLFVILVVGQRFSVPGLPVGLLLPVTLVWMWLAIRAGIVEIDLRRLRLWCVAVAVTGGAMLVQTAVHPQPVISVTSWALIIIVWFPAIARFADRRLSTYRLAMNVVVRVCALLAAACVVMMAIQFAGVPYRDILADVVPAALLEQGFTTSSPVEFGSEIYRSNGWVGLEPSTTSFLIAIGLLAAILVRSSHWIVGLLLIGLFTTTAGSGFLLLIVGLLAMLAFPSRRRLARVAVPVMVVCAALAALPFVQALLTRAGGASDDRSASLRAVQPYVDLWPSWSGEPVTALLGAGAGASQRVVDLGVFTALVPVPAKIFYDYGLVAGGVLAFFLLFCYLDAHSAVLAFTLFVSMWTVQPGSNVPVFAVPVLLLVTMWTPRVEHLRLEET